MLKSFFGKNSFIKNATILATGSIIGQILVVSLSPILTRLYSVESFGVLSVFTSISTILALFSTGRYELAIVLPKDDSKALKLFKLILYIAISVSLFYFIVIFVLKAILQLNDPTGFLKDKSAYLTPFYVFFVAVLSATLYWNQRNKRYKRISFANFIQSTSNILISIALGFFLVENGMILGLLFGVVFSILSLIIAEKDLIPKVLKKQKIKNVASEYKSFPKYMIFSDLSLNANQQLTPIIFSSLYNTTIVGHYSLANRILRLPNIMVASSFANVFRNDAIEEIRKHGECRALYISTFKKLCLLSTPVYILIFISSPFLFKFIFGSPWGLAGEFGRIISLYLLVEFITTPLNTLYYVRDKQKTLMRIQLLYLLMNVILLILSAKLFNNPKISLMIFSVNGILFNTILLVSSFKLSGKNIQSKY